MEPLMRESAEVEAWLAGTEAYEEGSRERLQETLRRRGEIAARIATLEEEWLWAQAEMDKALK
jgi:ATP-binding cassette subfamily F protein 3